MWGNGASWIRDSVPSVHEDQVLRLDASKARVELGWQPRLKIEAALEWTMAWYRAWNQGDNMAEFTEKQIAEYEHLLSSLTVLTRNAVTNAVESVRTIGAQSQTRPGQ